MFTLLVRVSSGYAGILAVILGLSPSFYLTIMVPFEESKLVVQKIARGVLPLWHSAQT